MMYLHTLQCTPCRVEQFISCTSHAKLAQFMRLSHKHDGLAAVSDFASSHKTRAQSQNRHRRWLAGDHRADLFVRLVDRAAFVVEPCGACFEAASDWTVWEQATNGLTCPPEAWLAVFLLLMLLLLLLLLLLGGAMLMSRVDHDQGNPQQNRRESVPMAAELSVASERRWSAKETTLERWCTR
jgi:hypothetical protein